MPYAPRVAFRVALTASVLLVCARLWLDLWWQVTDGACDFPEECLNTAYPRAFARAEWLWVLTNVAGLTTLGLAVARGSYWPSVLRLGFAWLVPAGAYQLTSWARFDDPALWAGLAHPSAPTLFGGLDWFALVLLAMSLVLYGWDVVRRLHELEAELEAREAASAAR